ncbi:YjbH domain-containing protein [uncultured Arcticibacterium sp.]|uniref:YjbH domain-containing protein n=1 Tax=uncultured Arcticibacterium sp. TaxID=2173042 RepID=UPI0030FA275E
MSIKKHIISSIIFFSLLPALVSGQDRLLKSLENIQLKDSIFLYEQRVHRNQFKYFEAVHATYPSMKGYSPLFQGVSMGTYSFQNGSINYSGEKVKAKTTKPFGKQYKLDFWAQPVFQAYFGNKDQSVESKTSILLNTHLILGKGLSFYTGITFPLINDLDPQPLNIRLAPTYLNHFYHGKNSNFFASSVGLFFNDRYGINVEYQHMDFNKKWSYGAEVSYTGYYYLYPTSYKYTDLRELLALANLAYRFPKNDLTINLTAGQFLHQDKGFRLDLIRQFSKAEIGFFGSFTENGATIGANLAIKIPPSGALESKRLRLRTIEDFRWEYIYSRGFKIAERFRLHYKLDQKLRQFHNSFWQNESQKGS